MKLEPVKLEAIEGTNEADSDEARADETREGTYEESAGT